MPTKPTDDMGEPIEDDEDYEAALAKYKHDYPIYTKCKSSNNQILGDW